jgi:inosose dehydratase
MAVPKMDRIRLGSAPDSWGVWLPDDPSQTPWHRFLDELSEAGYGWVELGPYGYLPTDPKQLTDELGSRGLQASGGDVAGGLHREDALSGVREAALDVAALTAAVGAEYLVFLPDMFRDISDEGRYTDVSELDAEAWRRLVDGVSEVGRAVKEEHGVTLVFHPHADSHVETQDEIERFLEDTDPDHVQLCLDTGHVAYGHGDNLALLRTYPERIAYVHLKQIDPDVLRQARAEDLSFAQAVRRGVCPEPPGGVPDLEPLVAELSGLDADLFAIVEQDLYPLDDHDVPLPIAERTKAYLDRCGIGSLAKGNAGRPIP